MLICIPESFKSKINFKEFLWLKKSRGLKSRRNNGRTGGA
jgi:hypothetical protein